jgi:hypothetical protein
VGNFLRYWVLTSAYAEGDMTVTTGAMELVDVGDTLLLVIRAGVPRFNLDVLYGPAALIRCVKLQLGEEPSRTRSHPQDFR